MLPQTLLLVGRGLDVPFPRPTPTIRPFVPEMAKLVTSIPLALWPFFAIHTLRSGNYALLSVVQRYSLIFFFAIHTEIRELCPSLRCPEVNRKQRSQATGCSQCFCWALHFPFLSIVNPHIHSYYCLHYYITSITTNRDFWTAHCTV